MINIEIDNETFKVPLAETILQSSSRVGVQIPRFCYHEKLSIAGNCRMCLVELVYPKSIKPVASCALPIVDNMKIFTNTTMVKKARESVIEFLLVNHPLDCPICDQGGECDLQDQTILYGSDRGRFYENKRSVEDKEVGPLVKTIMTRCIHCTRCVRFCNEIAGIEILGVLGRGGSMEIGTFIEKFLDTEISGNVIDLCPVGALTSKPYSFTARPWELRSVFTMDVLDSFCSSIRIDLRGLEILRILPLNDNFCNEEWISDKTRFFYDGLKRQRLQNPLIKINKNFISVSWDKSYKVLAIILKYFFKNTYYLNSNYNIYKYKTNFFNLINNQNCYSKIIGVVGSLVDLETVITFKGFLASLGSSNFFINNVKKVFSFDFRFNFLSSKIDLLKVDFFFLINFNPRLELPLLNIKIRKLFLENSALILSLGPLINLNYNYFHLSNNISDFFKIISGKNFFCRKILQVTNPVIMLGSLFLQRKDYFFFFKSFIYLEKYLNVNNLIKSNYSLYFVNSKVGLLNSFEVGFTASKNTTNILKSNYDSFFFFILGMDNISIFKLTNFFFNHFIVFFGHHADSLSVKSNIVFPTCAFTEKVSNYLNFQGFLRKTHFVLASPGVSTEDWKILLSFFLFLLKKVKFFTLLKKNSKYINSPWFDLKQNLNTFLKYNNNIFLNDEISYKQMFMKDVNLKFIQNMNNVSFFTKNLNFYMTDSITNSSYLMALCTQRFFINKNNFI
jgi:NADH-quinone oxidoreductase chain G